MQQPELSVMTPERVRLGFTLAGIGTRALAFLIDQLLILAAYAVMGLLVWLLWRVLPSGSVQRDDVLGAAIVIAFLMRWGYFILCEYFTSGLTVGKRLAGIRVVRHDGRPLTFAAAAVRNLLRIVDGLPTGYLLGLVVMLMDSRERRIGDIGAGTIVVMDHLRLRLPPLAASGTSPEPGAAVPEAGAVEVRLRKTDAVLALTGELPPGWADVIRQLIRRRKQMPKAAWQRWVAQTWERTLALPGVTLSPPDVQLTPRQQADLLYALVKAVRRRQPSRGRGWKRKSH